MSTRKGSSVKSVRKTTYTLPMPSAGLVRPGIETAEYQQRRELVLKALSASGGTAAAVVFAGEGGGHGAFKADPNFVYLTGITTEPGAAVVFNPMSEDPRRKITLVLKTLNPEAERWDRYREPLSLALREAVGFESVVRSDQLGGLLTTAARRSKKLACLHGFSGPGGNIGADLALYRKICERVVGCGIEDRTMLLADMRSIKSNAEIELMEKAASATAAGYEQLFALLKPGVSEKVLERALTQTYLEHGADAHPHAYDPIVGSGMAATVLHYRDNSAICEAGQLLLIDSGAQLGGYACDVSRTLPVSGTFTPMQREMYELVLEAQLAAIRVARAGAYMWQVDKAARDVIEKAGLGDAYFHSIGHQLGMDVHDATPDGPLKAGMVITVEPGIYLPDQDGGIGIRIEDDLLITKTGNQNLTKAIPKTVKEIEAAMRG